MTKLEEALEYALDVHKGQVRKGSGIPYITHVMAVMERVSYYTDDREIWIAAILHDVVEDAEPYNPGLHLANIADKFGPKVAQWVNECSRPEGNEAKHQKFAFMEKVSKSSKPAQLIKLADRVHNVMSYRQMYRNNADKKDYHAEYAAQAISLICALGRDAKNSAPLHEDVAYLLNCIMMTYGINPITEKGQPSDKLKVFLVEKGYAKA